MIYNFHHILTIFYNSIWIRKVLSKLNFSLSDEVIREVIAAKPGVIEKVLLMLRLKLERAEWELTKQPQHVKHKGKGGRRTESDKPEADQYMGRYIGVRGGVTLG